MGKIGTKCPECGNRRTVFVGDDGVSGEHISESFVCVECETEFSIEYYAECKTVNGKIVERI